MLQWLLNADKNTDIPYKRVYRFFEDLYKILKRNSKAILQFYPENQTQLNFIMSMAKKAGFNGGLIVDYPENIKNTKYYLYLVNGPFDTNNLPVGINNNNNNQSINNEDNQNSVSVFKSTKFIL